MIRCVNIALEECALALLRRNYWEPDVGDPLELRQIPTFVHFDACWDAQGRPVRNYRLGYVLCRMPFDPADDVVVASFDGGRRFFAVRFREPFNQRASYRIEHFDGTTYILKTRSNG